MFFHQSLHHVAKLEKLLSAVAGALRPGGLVYLDEYVGPSRTDWNDALMKDLRPLHAQIGSDWRVRDELPYPIMNQVGVRSPLGGMSRRIEYGRTHSFCARFGALPNAD